MWTIRAFIVRIVHYFNCPAGESLAVRWDLMSDDERHAERMKS